MNFKEWMDDEEVPEINRIPEMTPEIKEWLGNSTIQQPVYHGSKVKFDNFKYMPSKRYVLFSQFDVMAHGFFFSEKYEDAKEYGNNVVTAYVRMLNPLLDPRRDQHLGVDRLDHKKEAHMAFILRHMIKRDSEHGQYGDIGVTTFPVYARGKGQLKGKNIPTFHTQYEWIYNVVCRNGLMWDALDMPEIVASMKKLGYDGSFVAEDKGRSIFVPEANQIKIVGWSK